LKLSALPGPRPCVRHATLLGNVFVLHPARGQRHDAVQLHHPHWGTASAQQFLQLNPRLETKFERWREAHKHFRAPGQA